MLAEHHIGEHVEVQNVFKIRLVKTKIIIMNIVYFFKEVW